MLLTAGERIAMALLSLAIRELGGEAISFTGSQSGIITNDRHVDARIIEVRPFRVEDELARGRIVVIAGYQGVSYRREVTTLGRGGSDTTAVAMAAALGAEYCEICSDVDGVYTADPARRARGAAHRLAVLRGDAGAGRIGREGAERAGGRVREGQGHRHLRARDRLAAGRRIGRGRHRGAALPAPHARRRRRRGERARRARPRGRDDDDAAAVLAALDEHGVAGKQLHQSGAGDVTLVISRENLHDEGRLRADLASRFGGRVRLVDDLGALSVVGAGINQSFENLRRGSEALTAAGATPRGVATSSFRITWMVPRATLDDSVRTLHRIFLEQPSPALP